MHISLTPSPIEKIKEGIVNSMLFLITIVAIPLSISSLLRAGFTGWMFTYTFQIFLVFCLLIASISYRHTSRAFKGWIIIIILSLIGFSGMYSFGYFAIGKIYFIPVVTFAWLAINRRAGYSLLFLFSIYYLCMAYLYTYGNFEYSFNIMEYVYRPWNWLLYGLTIFVITGGILFLMGKFEFGYKKLISILESEKKNYQTIFEQAADGIILVDLKGSILMANPSFCRSSGYSQNELEGKKIAELIHPDNLEEDPLQLSNIGYTDVVLKNRKGIHKNGSEIDVDTQGIKLSDGRIQIYIRDISAQKQFDKNLYLASISAEEGERTRLARELHDGLGPLLSTTKIYIHNLGNKNTQNEQKEYIQKLTSIVDDSIQGIKDISNNISPHILRNFGLCSAVENFVQRLDVNIPIQVICKGMEACRYDDSIEITLYRIITELINNTLKHANAKQVTVKLKEKSKKLFLSYSDDGDGFNFSKTMEVNNGYGLYNLQSRVKSMNGKLQINTSPGNGMRVLVELDILKECSGESSKFYIV